MMSRGPGAIMVGLFRFPESVRAPAAYSGLTQRVMVHASNSGTENCAALFVLAGAAAGSSLALLSFDQCEMHADVVRQSNRSKVSTYF
jgi:hypothetical protein